MSVQQSKLENTVLRSRSTWKEAITVYFHDRISFTVSEPDIYGICLLNSTTSANHANEFTKFMEYQIHRIGSQSIFFVCRRLYKILEAKDIRNL